MSNFSGAQSISATHRETSLPDSHRLVVADPGMQKSYLARTYEMLAVDFPNEYVERADILTFLDQKNGLCGGVMLVSQGPFRSIESIPPEARMAHRTLASNSDIAEINGLWLEPEINTPVLSIAFWRLIIGRLIESQKSRFLFTYDESNTRMKLLTDWLNPTTLYSGETLPLPGMNSTSQETISLVDVEPIQVLLEKIRHRGSKVVRASNTKPSRLNSQQRTNPDSTAIIP